jgi:hypothetical protein
MAVLVIFFHQLIILTLLLFPNFFYREHISLLSRFIAIAVLAFTWVASYSNLPIFATIVLQGHIAKTTPRLIMFAVKTRHIFLYITEL